MDHLVSPSALASPVHPLKLRFPKWTPIGSDANGKVRREIDWDWAIDQVPMRPSPFEAAYYGLDLVFGQGSSWKDHGLYFRFLVNSTLVEPTIRFLSRLPAEEARMLLLNYTRNKNFTFGNPNWGPTTKMATELIKFSKNLSNLSDLEQRQISFVLTLIGSVISGDLTTLSARLYEFDAMTLLYDDDPYRDPDSADMVGDEFKFRSMLTSWVIQLLANRWFYINDNPEVVSILIAKFPAAQIDFYVSSGLLGGKLHQAFILMSGGLRSWQISRNDSPSDFRGYRLLAFSLSSHDSNSNFLNNSLPAMSQLGAIPYLVQLNGPASVLGALDDLVAKPYFHDLVEVLTEALKYSLSQLPIKLVIDHLIRWLTTVETSFNSGGGSVQALLTINRTTEARKLFVDQLKADGRVAGALGKNSASAYFKLFDYIVHNNLPNTVRWSTFTGSMPSGPSILLFSYYQPMRRVPISEVDDYFRDDRGRPNEWYIETNLTNEEVDKILK